MNFPTLYKKTHGGAIESWTITALSTDGIGAGVIETNWGQVAGKRQTTQEVIKTGKNIGRANETSPLEQAVQEARSRWLKKKKKGYVESDTAAEAGEVDAVITGGVEPMLAPTKVWPALAKKMPFPAFVQPKLNGHRCIAIIKDGKATLWSRTRKPILSSPHIIAELERMSPDDNVVLDGELYNHDYRDHFEDLSSLIRQSKPMPGHENIQYHVYDLVTEHKEDTYEERATALRAWFTEAVGYVWDAGVTYVKPVVTYVAAGAEVFDNLHLAFVAQGYEGSMIRAVAGTYEGGKRSSFLQKRKDFDDSEFLIVGVVSGRGKLAGHGIFHCLVDAEGEDTELNSFDVKMNGPEDQLIEFFSRPQDYIGRVLTVKHKGWTADRKPLHPVGWQLSTKL